ncbi:MAG TPA: hypothetical protein PKD37_04735 [Oligoflexia bacterium]|nr:hypothetical protein [Oligoflexia bacterium]HMP27271.1 hypothetical protein [Oligoflexia bacterium]
MSEFFCYKCLEEAGLVERGKVSRQALCQKCGAYLRCCLNCENYDECVSNQCREPQAELISDKSSGNFCDYFKFKAGSPKKGLNFDRDSYKKKLDDLFKK